MFFFLLLLSLSLCLLRVLDEILQKLVHLVQEEDCVSKTMQHIVLLAQTCLLGNALCAFTTPCHFGSRKHAARSALHSGKPGDFHSCGILSPATSAIVSCYHWTQEFCLHSFCNGPQGGAALMHQSSHITCSSVNNLPLVMGINFDCTT